MKLTAYKDHLFIALLAFSLSGSFLHADWATDPHQSARVISGDTPQVYPLAVSDMRHGAIVVWVRGFVDLYAQRIDQYGNEAWTPGGIPVCTAPETQYTVSVISDGAGGVFVVWRDFRDFIGNYNVYTSTNALYVQHIDSSGQVRWQPDGVKIQTLNQDTSESRTDYNPTGNEQLVRDDAGGVYAFWESSRRDSLGNYHGGIFAQHINAVGEKLWGEEGRLMYDSRDPLTLTDGAHGFYLFYGGVIGSRFSEEGIPVWDSTLTIHSTAGFGAHMIPDGGGGFIWAGFHLSNEDYVGLQHVNRAGEKLWGDGVNYYPGHEVRDLSMELVNDGNGGAFVSWMLDYSYAPETIHINNRGEITWPEISPTMASLSDSIGGYYYSYSSSNSDIDERIITRIDSNGATVWAQDSVVFYRRNEIHAGYGTPQIISDGRHGVITIWNEIDSTSNVMSVIGQLINADGELGRVISGTENETGSITNFSTVLNYPNPFNGTTKIIYSVPKLSHVQLIVYNIRGQKVQTLVEKLQTPGEYATEWNGKTTNGKEASNGIYFCALTVGVHHTSTKLLLIK